ncbi:MAG: 50S ribosomal protein L33 [Myxococcales bacterium FL481]|nr:MAG: 50S ribosomal protein L33 [Myxococcales bacterium FL481]
MATKGNRIIVKIVSEGGTGFFYSTMKNKRNSPDRLRLRKYDPKLRKHVMFKESK